jgi:hypothetical protein
MKSHHLIAELIAWLGILILAMILLAGLHPEVFLFLSMIGLIGAIYLAEPRFVRPRYLQDLKRVAGFGIILFGMIVVTKVLEILQI